MCAHKFVETEQLIVTVAADQSIAAAQAPEKIIAAIADQRVGVTEVHRADIVVFARAGDVGVLHILERHGVIGIIARARSLARITAVGIG